MWKRLCEWCQGYDESDVQSVTHKMNRPGYPGTIVKFTAREEKAFDEYIRRRAKKITDWKE